MPTLRPKSWCFPQCLELDRVNNRIQAFRLDGTYINEVFIERQTKARFGTGFSAAFSPDAEQRFFYVPDGTNRSSTGAR